MSRQKQPLTISVRGDHLGAGYGIRTRGLNFGKVACCHYTKPAMSFLTLRIIADRRAIVKLFSSRCSAIL